MRWLILLVFPLVMLVGCMGNDPTEDLRGPVDTEEIALVYPDYFPAPDLPENNPLTATKVKLGKMLFFDPILSKDNSVSCASCHFQENAFSDPRPFSPGVGGVIGGEAFLRRNAPPLFNLAWHTSLFWDGAIEDETETYDLMENQVRVPIEADHEMDSDFETVISRLSAIQEYQDMFWQAFGDTITELRIMQAIASYERTLISAGSKYDQFVAAGFDSTVFTSSEWRGYKLYFAESGERHAECFHCHGGFNFDDPSGEFRGNGIFDDYEDFGRFNITGNQFDFGNFKVPSLRNIEYTAPYMHDGSVQSLEEVLDLYVSASENDRLPLYVDPLISNIVLTEQDKGDIVAFLKTLSDPSFLTNPDFGPE